MRAIICTFLLIESQINNPVFTDLLEISPATLKTAASGTSGFRCWIDLMWNDVIWWADVDMILKYGNIPCIAGILGIHR